MLAKLRASKEEEGFTLIELLVVVIIIGILAAIAIPVFLNQRESAWRGAAQSDARNAGLTVETYFTAEQDYPAGDTWGPGPAVETLTATSGATFDVVVSDGVSLVFVPNGTTDFEITASHANLPGETWVYDSAAGGMLDAP